MLCAYRACINKQGGAKAPMIQSHRRKRLVMNRKKMESKCRNQNSWSKSYISIRPRAADTTCCTTVHNKKMRKRHRSQCNIQPRHT